MVPNNGLVAAAALLVEQNLRAFLTTASIARTLERQWKLSPRALLPLVILGHEEDHPGLWSTVHELDPRFKFPDLAEEADSVRLLECALDACSASIIEEARASVMAISPAIELARGLVDGYWCVYALLPRGCWSPPEKPAQPSLF